MKDGVRTPGLLSLYIMAFLMASGFTVQGFAAVFHLADKLGAGAGAVGRATGIQGLAYLGGCFLFPLVRKGEGLSQDFRFLFAAAPLLAGFTVSFYFAPSLSMAILLLAGTGFATAFLWPPLMGIVSSLGEGPALNRVMARYNLSWTLGPVVMPMIAGALYMRGAFYAFSAAALLFAGGGLVYIFFLVFRIKLYRKVADRTKVPENGFSGNPEKEEEEEAVLRGYRIRGWILLFSEHVVMGLLIFILPLSLRADSGLNEFSVGAVVFGRSIMMTVGMWLFGHLDFWHFNRKTPPLIAGIYTLLIAGMYFFQNIPAVYFVLIPLTGLPAAFFYSSGVFHGVAGAVDRSRRMAVTESLMTGGMFIGAALGGTLYQSMGLGIALAVSAGFLLSGTVISLSVVKIMDNSGNKTPIKESAL